MQSRWDCDINSIMAPPKHKLYNDTLAGLKFLKEYDGLKHLPVTNILKGTCSLGQLIGPGYHQELANGLILRSAYLGKGAKKSMRLFKSTTLPHDIKETLFYRSDDGQRTLMSGEMLISSLFESFPPGDNTITLHSKFSKTFLDDEMIILFLTNSL